MAIDNTFIINQIRTRKSMVVAFCAYTNMPLVVCDPETFNDQVFVFENEKLLQEFAKPYTEKKILLRGVKYMNKDFLKFFSSLFLCDVNEIVFVNTKANYHIQLDKIVKKPDFSKLEPQKRPVTNPSLLLTGMYFAQEAARPIKPEDRTEEEAENLKELQEELGANMARGRFIVAIELNEGPGTPAEKLKNNEYKVPIIKMKDESIWQPAFTDTFEFNKYAKGKPMTTMAVPFALLGSFLTKDSKGFMVNPMGIKLIANRDMLLAAAKNAAEAIKKQQEAAAAQGEGQTGEEQNGEEQSDET